MNNISKHLRGKKEKEQEMKRRSAESQLPNSLSKPLQHFERRRLDIITGFIAVICIS